MRISDWSSDVCSSDLARVDIGILDCATVLKLRPHHHLACHAPLDTPALIFVGDREGLQLTGESRHHEILGLGRCAAKEPIVLELLEKGEHFAPLVAAKSFCHQSTRSEEHTSELQSLMSISYAVFCLNKKNSADRYAVQLTIYLYYSVQWLKSR